VQHLDHDHHIEGLARNGTGNIPLDDGHAIGQAAATHRLPCSRQPRRSDVHARAACVRECLCDLELEVPRPAAHFEQGAAGVQLLRDTGQAGQDLPGDHRVHPRDRLGDDLRKRQAAALERRDRSASKRFGRESIVVGGELGSQLNVATQIPRVGGVGENLADVGSQPKPPLLVRVE
jgi:hypothetical protein